MPGRSAPPKTLPNFEDLHQEFARPSLPPEQPLKPRWLTALCSLRSRGPLCDQPGYNLLWLGLLNRRFSRGSFDPSVFGQNSQRVLSADMARRFFAEVYMRSRQWGWTSNEHFSTDGTLVE